MSTILILFTLADDFTVRASRILALGATETCLLLNTLKFQLWNGLFLVNSQIMEVLQYIAFILQAILHFIVVVHIISVTRSAVNPFAKPSPSIRHPEEVTVHSFTEAHLVQLGRNDGRKLAMSTQQTR